MWQDSLRRLQMSIKQAVFQLNGEEYGLDITQVNTIEKDLEIIKADNLPKNIKGKVKIRGNELPVYSLRRKFGIPDAEADKNTRYLITNAGDVQIALEVDLVKGIKDFDQSDIFDVPEVIKSSDTSYLKSIAHSDEGLVLLLDSSMLMSGDEIKALEKSKSN